MEAGRVGVQRCELGDEALAEAFRDWQWSRAKLEEGAAVLYDVCTRDGEQRPRGWFFGAEGAIETLDAGVHHTFEPSRWSMPRSLRSDAKDGSRLLRSLEDTPFYSRNLIASSLRNQPIIAMHESLCLERFERRSVQLMLPFRMRRPR